MRGGMIKTIGEYTCDGCEHLKQSLLDARCTKFNHYLSLAKGFSPITGENYKRTEDCCREEMKA